MIMAIVSEFDYLCRLCATKTGILMGLPIFDAEIHADELRHIDKKIAVCLPVQVSMSDQLPKVVCEECAFKLDQMFDFREKCIQTENLFIEMLKEIKVDIKDVDELPEIENDINRIHKNIDGIQNRMDSLQDDNKCVNHSETSEPTIHTMQVMDEMDLAGGEQVVTQEEIGRAETEIEVRIDDCLDGDTVRLVDEHIRDVSNHQITMLDGEMTVVGDLTVDGHLGIDYVTTMNSESQGQEQIVHYVDNVKFETVSSDGFPQTHQDSIESDSESLVCETEATVISNNIPSTSQGSSNSSEIPVQYTKRAKFALLENVINNPTIDDAGSSWYVCPFCMEAASDPDNLAVHFEQHFCSCTCGINFTCVEDLTLHKNNCKKKKKEIITKNEKTKAQIQVQDVITSESTSEVNIKKQQPNVRQKWTPKVCTQCGKQYRTNYKLQEHMRKHTGEKPFQCLLCDKAFRSKIGLAQHTATHTGQFDYSCSTCGKGFQCKSYLIVHQRVHSDLKPYPCDTCGQNFKTKQSLLDHQNRHLGVKPYMCEICGRGFITKGLCKSHQKIHSGMDNRQYPCEVCNKMFVSKSYLNTHLRIHTGEKPYLCEVCGKGFLTRVDLKIHSTMHTGEKSFKCEMCNKVFARRAALRCHRRSHTGERPYRCDVCGKTFTQFSPMAIHKRLHTGERPYECDVCGKAFVSRSTMMCHRKKHHQATAPEKQVNHEDDGIEPLLSERQTTDVIVGQ